MLLYADMEPEDWNNEQFELTSSKMNGESESGEVPVDHLAAETEESNRRRSSRIKSLEERKEIERAEREKIQAEQSLHDQPPDPEMVDNEIIVPSVQTMASIVNNGSSKHQKGEKSKSKHKHKKKKSRRRKIISHNDDSSEDSGGTKKRGLNDGCYENRKPDFFTPPLPPSHFSAHKTSCLTPTSSKTASDSDESPKPEKIKSRWRRNSELESGHHSEPSSFMGSPDRRAFGSLNNSLSPNPSSPAHTITIPKETAPVPPFEHLEDNVYLFDRRKSKGQKDVRRMVCDCILMKEERQRGHIGCGEDCLNRMLMIECGSRCPLGEHCANKRFQKKQYAKVEPFKTPKKGWGLRVLQPLKAGSFIMEYVGEVLDLNEFRVRIKKYSKEKRVHHYFMALKSDEIIDATQKGNVGRFVNHSCEPNCETQKWTVNGKLRIGVFTKRNIQMGDEITFDYQFQRYGKEAQKCYCETESCRGYIGANEVDENSEAQDKLLRTPNDGEFEEEVEKLVEIGGMRNRQQVINVAKLMVRAEETASRRRLLNVIKGTPEVAYLRLFLDYHGLQLLWGWMVESEDDWLKSEILEVLQILPIPNKTMLMDSKVIQIVERWSKQTQSEKLVEENSTEPNEKEIINIAILSTKLLNSWKDLKEIFRIPRLERQKRHEDEKEADRRTKEFEERRASGLPLNFKRGTDDRDYTIAGILGLKRKNTKRQLEDKKQLINNQISPGNFDANINITNVPTPPKVNKEEHRKQFEIELMRKQYEQAIEEYKKKMEIYQATILQQFLNVQPDPQTHQPPPLPPPFPNVYDDQIQNGIIENHLHDVQTENTSQLPEMSAAYPDEDIYYEDQQPNGLWDESAQIHDDTPYETSVLRECTNSIHELMDDTHAAALVDNIIENDIKSVAKEQLENNLIFDPLYPSPGTYYLTPEGKSYFVPSQKEPTEITIFEDVPIPFPPSFTSEIISAPLPKDWSIKTDVRGNRYYTNRPLFRSQWEIPQDSPLLTDEDVKIKDNTTSSCTTDSTSTPHEELKTSSAVSLETSPIDAFVNENSVDRTEDAECSCNMTNISDTLYELDPRKRKIVVNLLPCATSEGITAVSSSNSHILNERKIKEKFKEKVSEFIIHCLNPYRKYECKVGRILTNDDFKYLARKLTHIIVGKEEKHCRQIEELNFNEAIRYKAKDFVKKYMAKQGPIYFPEEKNLSPKDAASQDSVTD